MRFLPLVALILLAACSDGPSSDQAVAPATRAERKAKRIQAAETQLARTPTPRTYRYPDAELRVFQLPVSDGSGFVEQQNCFVWRDLEFKTATLSCSVPPEVLPAN